MPCFAASPAPVFGAKGLRPTFKAPREAVACFFPRLCLVVTHTMSKLDQLVEMGFPREECKALLDRDPKLEVVEAVNLG